MKDLTSHQVALTSMWYCFIQQVMMWKCQVSEYCFTSLSAQSWQYRDRRVPEARTIPYSYFEWLQALFIVHSTKGSTVHSMSSNSLEHCICTTMMANIRPDRDENVKLCNIAAVSRSHVLSQQTWDVGPTFVCCWSTVYDVGPTANQR